METEKVENKMYAIGYQSYEEWTDGDLAAKMGHFDLMKAKHSNGEPLKYTIHAVCNAAERGDLEMVKWLHNQGVKCTTWATLSAAVSGHVNVVKFLIELPMVAYDSETIDRAVAHGQFEVVKCLIQHRKTFTTFTLSLAKKLNRGDILEYLNEHLDQQVDPFDPFTKAFPAKQEIIS